MNRSRNASLIALVVVAILAGLAFLGWDLVRTAMAPAKPETIVSASLESLKEQNILVPFTARFVADPTSRVRTLGLTAQKTLIVPGMVRYEVDLGAMTADNLDWDAEAKALTVTLPPLRVSAPEMDPAGAVEYRDGELVMAVTDAEKMLDDANWKAARAEILTQAKGATPMRLAQTAAINAVRSNFALPLKAAGVDAEVTVRFNR
ncbi:MAG: DUF4230 domain-containing protein [Sphingopyxis sp.]|nr:DUF4230 domain-containing protein [Sphingopyxis sp.]